VGKLQVSENFAAFGKVSGKFVKKFVIFSENDVNF